MSDVASILFVNEAFYDAFRLRDMETMETLWSRRADVACIHPGWHALVSREEVMESWRGILGNEEAPQVTCHDPHAYVLGNSGFVVCYEQIGNGILVATNVFVKEGSDWRLVHHQAGPCNLPLEDLDESPDSSGFQ